MNTQPNGQGACHRVLHQPRCYIPCPMNEFEDVARFQSIAKSLERGWVLAFLAALLPVGCGESSNPRQEAPISIQSEASAENVGQSNADRDIESRFGSALERAAADPSERTGLYLNAGCRSGSAYRSMEIFEHGVAIWGGERQLGLTESEITGLLLQIVAAEFASLPERYGGSPEQDRMQADSARTVVCALSVAVGGTEKEVLQIDRGEQSESFAVLVNGLLDAVEERVAEGTTAKSLEDGLEKVAAGELDPVTLEIHFQLLNGAADAVGTSNGYLLGLQGLKVETRVREAEEGYSDPSHIMLTDAEVRRFAWQLAEWAPTRFPKNSWAPDYRELTIRVLNRKVSLVARPYLGVGPETHGELQQDFDATIDILETLHSRVLEEGVVGTTEAQ